MFKGSGVGEVGVCTTWFMCQEGARKSREDVHKFYSCC